MRPSSNNQEPHVHCPWSSRGTLPPQYLLEGNTAGQKQPGNFLECIDDNFLAQMIEELMGVDAVPDLVLTEVEGQVGDVNAGRSLGCSGHEMVEFRILNKFCVEKSVFKKGEFLLEKIKQGEKKDKEKGR